MKLHRIEFALVVGDDRDRGARSLGYTTKPVGQFRDPVAMAHPDVVFATLLPDAVEQRAIIGDFDGGASKLAVMTAFDGAAKLLRHGLLAIADAEHRDARRQDRRVVPKAHPGPAPKPARRRG